MPCPICGDQKAYVGFNMVECHTETCINFKKPKISISARSGLGTIIWDRGKDVFILPGGTIFPLSNIPKSLSWNRKVPAGIYVPSVTWRDVADWVQSLGIEKVSITNDSYTDWPDKGQVVVDKFVQKCKEFWPEGWTT